MSTALVNGRPAEPGCYCEGHWGWHNLARMIEKAQGFGFDGLSAEDETTLARCDAGEDDPTTDGAAEACASMADDAESWLNDHTAITCQTCGYPMEWRDGLTRCNGTTSGR